MGHLTISSAAGQALLAQHDARVEGVGGRYPYRPTCSCGAAFRGCLTRASAQILVDAHLADEVGHLVLV